MTSQWGRIVNYTKIKLLEFCILPGHDILYHEECEKFMDSVLEVMRMEIVNRETHMAFDRILPQHMLYHMRTMIKHSNIKQLKKKLADADLKDIPAVIVSAGPSLDKNVHLLKNTGKGIDYHCRCFNTSCDTGWGETGYFVYN